MKRIPPIIVILLASCMAIMMTGCIDTSQPPTGTTVPTTSMLTLKDGFGREITAVSPPESVICSGSGCMRYLVYLQGQDLVIGVDDIEKDVRVPEGRPYSLSFGSQFRDLPLIGEFRGRDDPEKIIGIGPDVIFKTGSTGTTYATSGPEADKLQEKTGIPVVSFPYGSLRNGEEKADMHAGLRMMGKILGKDDRAEEVIAYIEETIKDLERRTADIPASEQKFVYVGGVSSAGTHGIISTEPAYPPFLWIHAQNAAAGMGIAHADIAKEALVDRDPEFIFIDVATIQPGSEGAIGELKNDPALQGLTAAKEGRVYGVFPYNFYNINYESVFADAYFIGKILYPDRFADVDPVQKADELFSFFVGKPVFSELNSQYGNLGFSQIPVLKE
jgi:iron complex transport system substrate-binding protein